MTAQMRTLVSRVRSLWRGVKRHRILIYSSSGAYYIFLSFVPLLLLFSSLLSFTDISQADFMEIVATYMPQSMYEFMIDVVDTVYAGGSAAVTVSAVLTVWSASASARAIMRGMDVVYNVTRRENIAFFYIRGCLYMLAFVAVFLLVLVVLVYGEILLGWIRNLLPHSADVDFIFYELRALRFPVTMAFLVLVFMGLYTFIPAQRQAFKDQWIGAVFTSVMWTIFSAVFSVYASNANSLGAYGYVGTIIVVLMWMHYCLFFLLVGGHINYLSAKRRRRK